MHHRLPRSLPILLALFAAAVWADINWGAALSGNNEVPPVPTMASGYCTLTLHQPSNMITYKLRIAGLVPTAAHVHRAAVGQNGPIIFPLDHLGLVGSIGPLTAAQIIDLWTGLYYVNVHTNMWPGGEIRGQVSPEIKDPYIATLNGANEVPPNPSTATGTAYLVLNRPENTISYEVITSGLVGGNAAHIHTAPTGMNGPVTIPLNGTPPANLTRWCGISPPLTAGQLNDLISGNLYVNVHTNALPGGEIRGQIGRDTFNLFQSLSGANEVPPNASMASGFTVLGINQSTLTVNYNVQTNVANSTAGHLHTAPPGQNGGVTVPYAGTGPNFAGAAVTTAAVIENLKSRALYSNVHSMAFPGGEVRGQMGQNPSVYGHSAAGVGGLIPHIGWRGLPAQGTTFTINVKDARPNGAGFLFLAFAPAAIPLSGAGLGESYLWLNLAAPIFFALPMDGTGCSELPLGVPVGPVTGIAVHFQWAVDAPGVNPGGYVTTDAVTAILQP